MSRIKYGGATHCALKYAKMKRNPVGVTEIMECFPTKFDKPSRVKETMTILSKYGFMMPIRDMWKITAHGEEYLRGVAQTFKGQQ